MRIATLTTAVLAATVLGLAPAHADTERVEDATQDVREFTFGAEPRGLPASSEPRPGDKARDIVVSRAEHAGSTVELSLEVRELADSNWNARWRIRTPDSSWIVSVAPGKGGPLVNLYENSPVRTQRGQACEGLDARTSDAVDRVRAVVQRACIGRPEWVRFGSLMIAETAGGFKVDDGRGPAPASGDGPRLGPRIDRG